MKQRFKIKADGCEPVTLDALSPLHALRVHIHGKYWRSRAVNGDFMRDDCGGISASIWATGQLYFISRVQTVEEEVNL